MAETKIIANQTASDIPKANLEEYVINGDFQVNQYELLDITGWSSDSVYFIDRFKSSNVNVPTYDIDLLTTNQPESRSYGQSVRISANSTTSPSTGILGFYTVLDSNDYKQLQGRTVVISAWVKSNNLNAKISILINGATRIDSSKVSSSGVWERLSIIYTMPTSITYLDIGLSMGVNESIIINATDYIEGTDISLKIGSSLSDYNTLLYDTQLYRCSRFAHLVIGQQLYSVIGKGHAGDTSSAYIEVPLPPNFRSNPTAITMTASDWKLSDGAVAYDVTGGGSLTGGCSSKFAQIYVTVAGTPLTAGKTYRLECDGTTNRKILLTAEL